MQKEKKLSVPLSAVTGLIESMEPRDWLVLREWLDEKLAEREDELMLRNPRIRREIHEALAEYQAGKFLSVRELRSSIRKKSRRGV